MKYRYDNELEAVLDLSDKIMYSRQLPKSGKVIANLLNRIDELEDILEDLHQRIDTLEETE